MTPRSTFCCVAASMLPISSSDSPSSTAARTIASASSPSSFPSAHAIAARGVYRSDLEFAAFLLQEQARLTRLYMSGLPRDLDQVR